MKEVEGAGKGEIGDSIGHAPPLQEFGEVTMRSVRDRIQSCEDKLTCACQCLSVYRCKSEYHPNSRRSIVTGYSTVTDSRAQLPLRSDAIESRDLRRAALRWSC